jgi:hypothetical protein
MIMVGVVKFPSRTLCAKTARLPELEAPPLYTFARTPFQYWVLSKSTCARVSIDTAVPAVQHDVVVPCDGAFLDVTPYVMCLNLLVRHSR